jgi:hypothetical protein
LKRRWNEECMLMLLLLLRVFCMVWMMMIRIIVWCMNDDGDLT